LLTRLFTSGKEDIDRVCVCVCVSMLQETFQYSLWTDKVDFFHIYYIHCDLFDCCNFNYEIVPATLANTFLFILQSGALADLRYGDRF